MEIGVSFIGSYCARPLAALSSKRRICGSVRVAQRARKYKRKKIKSPPSKLLRRLKVAAPRHMAKKNSFRSAPRMVRGRERARCTRLIRLESAMFRLFLKASESIAGKEPSQEIHGGDSHAAAEQHA